jgi:hypothetical protein
MKNGICMKAVTNSVENELSHHGILGMSWGKRFGPPYPLGGVDKKVARAEAKRKKQQEKRVAALQKAAKKARKAKLKAAKKEKKELERQVKINEQKQKLLEEDNYKKIMKNRKLFTNEELKYIKERHDQQIADKLDRMINRAAKVTNLVNNIANVTTGIKMLQSLRQQSKLNTLEINRKTLENQKLAEDYTSTKQKNIYEIAQKKGLAEQAAGVAQQQRMKGVQEYYKAISEGHKSNVEGYKAATEKSLRDLNVSKNKFDTYTSNKNLTEKVNSDYFDDFISKRKNPKTYQSLGSVISPITANRYNSQIDTMYATLPKSYTNTASANRTLLTSLPKTTTGEQYLNLLSDNRENKKILNYPTSKLSWSSSSMMTTQNLNSKVGSNPHYQWS